MSSYHLLSVESLMMAVVHVNLKSCILIDIEWLSFGDTSRNPYFV